MEDEPGRFEVLLARLEEQPKWQIMAWGILLTLFLGVIDFLTGTEILIVLFYLFPVALVAWGVGEMAGMYMAVLTALIRLMTNLLAGQRYSHPLIYTWNTEAYLGVALLVNFLLSQLHIALRNAKTLARTDSLTGALNRHTFREILAAELDRARRYSHPFTVAYIDLDSFKPFNDRFGHGAGDQALKKIADIFLHNIRRTDVFARLGGDEFILYLPETGPKQAQSILQRLQKVLLEAMQVNQWGVTFSVGAVTFLSYPESVDEVIRAADQLMYEVKQNNKNGIAYSTYEK